MRRLILGAAGTRAFLAALAVGPLGTAAAAPYVYGCTPASFHGNNTAYEVDLSIYNGSPGSANLTMKVLAGNGHILNDGPALPLPVASTLPPTHTAVYAWFTPVGQAIETNGNVPASVRIVSNVPVSATLIHDFSNTADWKPVLCSSQQP